VAADLTTSWSLFVQLRPKCHQRLQSLNHDHSTLWVLPVHADQTLPAYLCLHTRTHQTARLGICIYITLHYIRKLFISKSNFKDYYGDVVITQCLGKIAEINEFSASDEML